MLIPSSRISTADQRHWDLLEAYDVLLAADPRLVTLEADAVAALRAWRTQGPGVISTSWGKDSVVVAHLAVIAGIDARLVWVRSDPYEMPECEAVRDAFLATHPSACYEERVAILRNPKRGEPGYEEHVLSPNRRSQDVLGEMVPERYASGVRAEESKIRAISIGHRGLVTRNTSRPIGKWAATHVFAYLHREGLPVHSAYAMSFGGRLDRRWIRVHPLCSTPPPQSAVHFKDTATWEDHYYGDHIAEARRIRAASA